MSGISSLSNAAQHQPVQLSRQPSPKTPQQDSDSGPGAADLRRAPVAAAVGAIDLLA